MATYFASRYCVSREGSANICPDSANNCPNLKTDIYDWREFQNVGNKK